MNELGDGQARIQFKDGVYEGAVLRGLRHGKGSFSGTDFEYKCQWVQDEIKGKVILRTKDGSTYKGKMKIENGIIIVNKKVAQIEGKSLKEFVAQNNGSLKLRNLYVKSNIKTSFKNKNG